MRAFDGLHAEWKDVRLARCSTVAHTFCFGLLQPDLYLSTRNSPIIIVNNSDGLVIRVIMRERRRKRERGWPRKNGIEGKNEKDRETKETEKVWLKLPFTYDIFDLWRLTMSVTHSAGVLPGEQYGVEGKFPFTCVYFTNLPVEQWKSIYTK